jgi:hypothetical protein
MISYQKNSVRRVELSRSTYPLSEEETPHYVLIGVSRIKKVGNELLYENVKPEIALSGRSVKADDAIGLLEQFLAKVRLPRKRPCSLLRAVE